MHRTTEIVDRGDFMSKDMEYGLGHHATATHFASCLHVPLDFNSR